MRNPYIVVVTSIFLGGGLLPVLLVTTVLPPPPGDCGRSPNLLEREYALESALLCEGQRGPLRRRVELHALVLVVIPQPYDRVSGSKSVFVSCCNVQSTAPHDLPLNDRQTKLRVYCTTKPQPISETARFGDLAVPPSKRTLDSDADRVFNCRLYRITS